MARTYKRPKYTRQERALAALELHRRRSQTEPERPSWLDWVPQEWELFAPRTKIRSGTLIIPFNPYSYQVRISSMIDQCRGVVVVKPRQHGLTEMIANKFLHQACLYPSYFAAVFSKGQDDTANIARRVRLMANTAGIKLANNNLKDISVEGGGRIVFRTASPDSGRGLESVWDILYDECAFVPGIEQIYGASTPAQSIPEQQGKAHTILLSTPNAKTGLYWDTLISNNGDRSVLDICAQMRERQIDPYQEWVDEAGWGKCIIHWRSHPLHRDNDRYLEEVAEKQRITWSQVQREYNLSFDDSTGGLLFNVDAVQRAATGQWAGPSAGRHYVIGIDPNFGGDDLFRCLVLDISGDPIHLVAEYAEAQKGTEYSINRVLSLVDAYRPLLVAVESNSGGRVILERLIKQRPAVRFEGVNTSRQSKIVNTDRVAIAIEQGELKYPPQWTGIEELKHFGLNPREAITGHDDAVMALAAAFSWIDQIDWRVSGAGRYRF